MKQIQTVYLVDDDEDDRMLIREVLQTIDGDLILVEMPNGKELIETLEMDNEIMIVP